MKSKAFVIINESHSLLPEQERILKENFDEFEFVKVPKEGWSVEQIEKVKEDLLKETKYYRASFVFVSPIPLLIKKLSFEAGFDAGVESFTQFFVLVFHNDRREKKELPDGRIIQTVASTGWQLV